MAIYTDILQIYRDWNYKICFEVWWEVYLVLSFVDSIAHKHSTDYPFESLNQMVSYETHDDKIWNWWYELLVLFSLPLWHTITILASGPQLATDTVSRDCSGPIKTPGNLRGQDNNTIKVMILLFYFKLTPC